MTDNKFDLGKFLAGVDRPEEEVLLYWNVKLANEIEELELQRKDLSLNADALGKLQKKQDKLIAERDKTAIRVTLKGVPQSVLESIDRTMATEYPITESFGEADAIAREDAKVRMKLLSYAIKVVDPSGSEQSPATEDTVDALMDMLHPMEFRKLQVAMQDLESHSLGHEIKATDPLFT